MLAPSPSATATLKAQATATTLTVKTVDHHADEPDSTVSHTTSDTDDTTTDR